MALAMRKSPISCYCGFISRQARGERSGQAGVQFGFNAGEAFGELVQLAFERFDALGPVALWRRIG